MPLIAFYTALALYLSSAAAAGWYVRSGSAQAPSLSRRLAGVGFALHTVFVIWWGVRHGRLPAYAPFEALVAFLWCAVLAYLMLDFSFRLPAMPAFVMPIIAVCGIAVGLLVEPSAQVTPVARSWWVPVHATVSLLGAADFVVAFAVAVMYLVQQRQLKHKTVGPLMERMPSLEALDRLNYRAVALGMPLFTLALILGVVLAVDRGPGWWANWMVATSLVAWLVYAILLHVRLGAGLRGPKVAYLTIFGFLLVAAIVCGIVFLGDALHRIRPAAASGRPSAVAEVDRDAR